MRTFFIVFLPGIGIFLLCALVGAAVLVASIRWSSCYVVRRSDNRHARIALAAKADRLASYQEQSRQVVNEILLSPWDRGVNGAYRFTLMAETAQRLIALQDQ